MDMDPVAFGGRLKREMALKGGWDVRRLEKELKSATGGARGTSYASVWSYVNGQAPSEPRPEVVRGLAKLFGVRADYLLFGGPRTDADAAVASLVAIATATGAMRVGDVFTQTGSVPDADEVLEDALVPLYQALAISDRSGGQVWVPALMEAWRRMTSGVEGIRADMEKLGRVLAFPLQELGIDPAAMEASELDAYVLTMVPALLLVARERKRTEVEDG